MEPSSNLQRPSSQRGVEVWQPAPSQSALVTHVVGETQPPVEPTDAGVLVKPELLDEEAPDCPPVVAALVMREVAVPVAPDAAPAQEPDGLGRKHAPSIAIDPRAIRIFGILRSIDGHSP